MPRVEDVTSLPPKPHEPQAGIEREGIFSLPSEILKCIFQFTDESSRVSSAFACREFNRYIGPSQYPKAKFSVRATEQGHLALVQWGEECWGCPFTDVAFRRAAQNGHLEIVQWAVHKGFQCDKIVTAAAEGGHLHVLKYLDSKGCILDQKNFNEVAQSGHFESLQWLFAKGIYQLDPATSAAAARSGRLDVLQWVRQNGCPWDVSTCAAIAIGGNLEMLKWARQEGCPLDEQTSNFAASSGHKEIIAWLIETDSLMDDDLWEYAMIGGNVEILNLLSARIGLPEEDSIRRHLCNVAARHGNLKALQLLRANGCEWGIGNNTATEAALQGRLEVFKWAIENGCPLEEPSRFVPRCPRSIKDDLTTWLKERSAK